MTKDAYVKSVTIIVPCFNEEQFISKCLESLINNGYPHDQYEILVIDGNSTDKTKDIVSNYAEKYFFIRLIDNPKRILAAAWNIGINNSLGEIVMALNAHGLYRSGYITNCVKHLNEFDADYVGGVIVSLPRNDTLMDNAITTILSHPFGVGNSYFRIGLKEPTWADTAAFGGYRRILFEKTGLFNEELTRSQDMEFHLRLKKLGARILLVPDMICDYYIRSSLKEFCRDYFINGYWVIYPLKFARIAVSWRHIIPLLFVLFLIGSIALSFYSAIFIWLFLSVSMLYLFINIYYSFRIALKKRNIGYLFIVPILFLILHIGYGVGSLYAGFKVITSKRFWCIFNYSES